MRRRVHSRIGVAEKVSVVADPPDVAGVGQPGVDQQPGQRAELLVDAARAVERGPDLREQRLPLALPVPGIDVRAAADKALLATEWYGPLQQPVVGAVGSAQPVLD